MRSNILNIMKASLLILLLAFSVINAATGKIKGTVSQADNNEALWGTNIILVNTAFGGSTDFDGNYSIINIPPGKYVLRVTYLGFESQDIEVEIVADRTLELDIVLKPEAIEGETVTITAQREGQLAAINQQITSDAIKNVVSSDKIEELPEANAAEAVGRLPGVSLEREGGEGNKVVIRGLAPKYNKVQIDGVDLASTDSDDRSTDLSMISPYLLGGIEVTKSAMADQEADQLGGTVNFVSKGAVYEKPTYKIILEGGYNGLRDEYKDYRFAFQASRREFDNAFGISVNADVERRNRSSNTVSASYYYLLEDQQTVVNSLSINDVTRELDRYGGSLMLDYKKGSTDLVFRNMFSRINRNTVYRSEDSNGLFSGSTSRTQDITFGESNTWVLMSQLRWNQQLGDIKFESGVSFSFSEDKTPEELSYGGLEQTPLSGPVNADAAPVDVPSFMKNNLSEILLNTFTDADEITREEEYSGFLDLYWEHRISDLINLKIKTGGKFKHKNRKYDYNTLFLNIFSDPSAKVNNALIEKYPWMDEYYTTGKFPYLPFIDSGFDPGDFMKGEYDIERMPDLELGKEVIYYLQDHLGVEYEGSTQPTRFTPNFHESRMNDYDGTEDYWAWYFMPTINIGEEFTLIPGLRYEKKQTDYNGVRGNANLQITESKGYVHYDTTVTRENDFFLPMIHVRYKPTDWFDIRASYTQTLSRPSYYEFLPSWHVYLFGVNYRNPNLKPAKSQNVDLFFSFYGNKIGLFTVGLFTKQIDDLIFSQNKIVVSDSMAIEEFGLREELTGQDPGRFVGKPIWYFVNNENTVDVRGIEVEWQSNLWYLPGLLKDIVFSVNYTYTFSEVKYPRTVPIKEIIQSPFGNREVIVGNADSSYTAPLISQPDHILNITLGYDYEGFSIRGSLQFKSQIFSDNDWRPELRGFTDDFTLIDLAISQKLPIDGLQVFGNFKNITKTTESNHNSGTGYITNKEYYGMNGNIGIKYQF